MSEFRTTTKTRSNIHQLAINALFLSLLIVGAYLRIPLGFMTITLQLVFSNLAGLLLGPKQALIVCSTYLLMGLIGLPVFTNGGGPDYVLNPTFGYIIGFALGAWLAGLILRGRQAETIKSAILFTVLNMLICYAVGATHFYLILNLVLNRATDIQQTLALAVYATLPKDLILGGLTAVVAVRVNKIMKR